MPVHEAELLTILPRKHPRPVRRMVPHRIHSHCTCTKHLMDRRHMAKASAWMKIGWWLVHPSRRQEALFQLFTTTAQRGDLFQKWKAALEARLEPLSTLLSLSTTMRMSWWGHPSRRRKALRHCTDTMRWTISLNPKVLSSRARKLLVWEPMKSLAPRWHSVRTFELLLAPPIMICKGQTRAVSTLFNTQCRGNLILRFQ
mmetsp:Transcript_6159/g.12664  ORF Transcript_6159/g.12664 Transcript_6159/m.12664 type:complete len:200 (-) Transcript_6159:1836-2435(-)